MRSSGSVLRLDTWVYQIKGWFVPPIFPNEEDKTRRANMLSLALVNIFVLIPVLIIGNLLGGNIPLASDWSEHSGFCLMFGSVQVVAFRQGKISQHWIVGFRVPWYHSKHRKFRHYSLAYHSNVSVDGNYGGFAI